MAALLQRVWVLWLLSVVLFAAWLTAGLGLLAPAGRVGVVLLVVWNVPIVASVAGLCFLAAGRGKRGFWPLFGAALLAGTTVVGLCVPWLLR